jgi:hypothetical protein
VEECNKLVGEYQDNVSLPILYLFDPKSRPQARRAGDKLSGEQQESIDDEEVDSAADLAELIPAVDIIPIINATEFKEKVESKKWSERVEGIKVESFQERYEGY